MMKVVALKVKKLVDQLWQGSEEKVLFVCACARVHVRACVTSGRW